MNDRRFRAALAPAWALCIALAGCSSPTTSTDAGADTGTDATSPSCEVLDCSTAPDSGESFDRVQSDRPSPGPTLTSIELSPTRAVIDVGGTTPQAVTFTVTGHASDGTTRTLTTGVTFSIPPGAEGNVSNAGVYTPGATGGDVTVTAALTDGSGLQAQATVTVNVQRTVLGAGLTAADVTAFEAASPSADSATTAPALDYPLEGAVMPRNVYPPLFQWTPQHPGAADTDVYRVKLVRAHATLTAYVQAGTSFTNSWRAAADEFGAIANTDVGTPIALTVAVLSGGVVRESAARSFRTVDAVIGGAVYYWAVQDQRIFRIDVEHATREDFLPNPPPAPDGVRCIACHVVSRDGRLMIADTEHNPAQNPARIRVYDLTQDLTGDPPPALATSQQLYPLPTFGINGDATRLVVARYNVDSPFALYDVATGNELPTSETLGTGRDPEWSPDSSAIAYTQNNNLMLTPALGGDHFGTPVMLHDATSSPDGTVDWRPSWTPDSRWMIYQHGSGVFTSAATAALWMISRDGTANVKLANLSAGGQNAFRPVASPFNSGGYYWVLFTSPRAYGNALAGIQGQKLIWAAAVSTNPQPGTDPSEVPYFLDGQEPRTNLDAHWAPPACRSTGGECSSDADCCTGTCAQGSTGRTCMPPTMCRTRGQTCSSSDECCNGLACSGRICDIPPPG